MIQNNLDYLRLVFSAIDAVVLQLKGDKSVIEGYAISEG
jgi:hypothetical protein